jgi:hypothetical protein
MLIDVRLYGDRYAIIGPPKALGAFPTLFEWGSKAFAKLPIGRNGLVMVYTVGAALVAVLTPERQIQQ